jgi:REP element-mobilizing transposase RayT
MSVRNPNHPRDGIFFITITCYKWIPLFEIACAYELVYREFDHLKQSGHEINAYVIMPNHFHCLIHFKNAERPINNMVSRMKRFMAYALIKKLKETKKTALLKCLSDGVLPGDRARGKLHRVFENSFDAKHCYSGWFIQQKLNYIHNNPCSGKWNLAPSPANYIYSSAAFYLLGEESGYPVMPPE